MMVIKMDNNYWVGQIREEFIETGKFDDEGVCPVCGAGMRGDCAEETYYLMEKHFNSHKSLKIVLSGYEVLDKNVKSHGNSGRVNVPVSWVGKRVKVVLLEPL
jgi:hypothetical protein